MPPTNWCQQTSWPIQGAIDLPSLRAHICPSETRQVGPEVASGGRKLGGEYLAQSQPDQLRLGDATSSRLVGSLAIQRFGQAPSYSLKLSIYLNGRV